MKSISILGATGSIGQTTLALIAHHPERFAVEVLVAQNNVAQLAADAVAHRAKLAVIGDETHYDRLKELLVGSDVEAAAGEGAILDAMARGSDLVVSAIVGAAGLKPTLAAIHAGSTIALANKECLVCAGELLMDEAAKRGVQILPVDSEHNALFQVFDAKQNPVKLTLTASGGPFLHRDDLQAITPEEAVKHPNWSMGAKISIDSATMMNKGLEVIEAFHLFPVSAEQIDVVVHPESVIHGLVQYADGSVLAGMSMPDMATPIAHCLSYPERIDAKVKKLDLAALGSLNFIAPDPKKFPALGLAFEALKNGPTATITLNAANECAVEYFLKRRIGFTQIVAVVAEVLASAPPCAVTCISDVLETDAQARRKTEEIVKKYARIAA